MKSSESINELASALCNAQGQMGVLLKTVPTLSLSLAMPI